MGLGWADRLVALVGLIHYAEHSILNICDAHRAFLETLTTVTARGRISDDGRNRLNFAALSLHDALRSAHESRDKVSLDDALIKRLGKVSWSDALEQFRLEPMRLETANSWIGVVGGWVQSYTSSMERLRDAALDELLLAEREVARLYALDSEKRTDAATAPPKVPDKYPTIPYGKERGEFADPGVWDSFFGVGSVRLVDSARICGARSTSPDCRCRWHHDAIQVIPVQRTSSHGLRGSGWQAGPVEAGSQRCAGDKSLSPSCPHDYGGRDAH